MKVSVTYVVRMSKVNFIQFTVVVTIFDVVSQIITCVWSSFPP